MNIIISVGFYELTGSRSIWPKSCETSFFPAVNFTAAVWVIWDFINFNNVNLWHCKDHLTFFFIPFSVLKQWNNRVLEMCCACELNDLLLVLNVNKATGKKTYNVTFSHHIFTWTFKRLQVKSQEKCLL